MKKGLALNITILLVLSIIALFIIGIILAKTSGTYTKSTSCESAGGTCLKATECDGERSFVQGCEEEQICCIQGD